MDVNNLSPASSSGGISPRASSEELPPLLSPQPLPPPTSKSVTTGHVRQNHVSSANLYGVSIVCLWIDAKERLCLAQISNTLLKEYSYNEIHNRRVALGITCVQCTPVQLEILRRAGAMPVSSRRCGMITKREAERLVKSFLEEMAPPKLPDDFAFDVSHDCGWGCRGSFVPSRYNSSRAKCVKCYYCNMYFSPNKFIFHFHRMPDSKYQHPDAANFNSWRRHLVLTDPAHSDDLMHAWEDVKAMFNGGSRKRVMASSAQSFTKNQDQSHVKRLKSSGTPVSSSSPSSSESSMHHQSINNNNHHHHPHHHHQSHPQPKLLNHAGLHRFPGAYPFPVFATNKHAITSPKPFPILGQPFPDTKLAPPSASAPAVPPPAHPHLPRQLPGGTVAPFPHSAETVYPSYEMIWAKHLGISMYNENSCYPPRCLTDANNKVDSLPKDLSPNKDLSPKDLSPKAPASETEPKFRSHFSAFKPVSAAGLFKPYEDLETSQDYSERDSASDSGESDSENIDVDTVDEDSELSGKDVKVEDSVREVPAHLGHLHPVLERDTVIASTEKSLITQHAQITNHEEQKTPAPAPAATQEVENEADAAHPSQLQSEVVDAHEPQSEADACGPSHVDTEEDSNDAHSESGVNKLKCDNNDNCLDPKLCDLVEAEEPKKQDHSLMISNATKEEDSEQQVPRPELQLDRALPALEGLSRVELQDELATALETRRRLEEEFTTIKSNFEKQTSQENAYREEMSRQIQVVRESLCRELEHERKTRASLQLKLKEAQDAINKFSYKMLDTGPC